MKPLKIITAVLLVIVIIIISYLVYMGMFRSIKTTERESGPYVYAFKKYTGPYSGSGVVFNEVYNELKSAGVVSELGIGIYYDNPAVVDSSKLKSDCGSIIAEADIAKVRKISSLSISTIPKGVFMEAEFPIKSRLSYMFGPIKVYPVFKALMDVKNYKPSPGIEIYDMKNNKIIYLMQVIK